MLPTVFKRNGLSTGNLIDEIVNDSFLPGFLSWNGDYAYSNKPKVNIVDHENEYVIDVAAPGLEKKDFNVQIDGDVLKISSEQKTKNEEKHEGYLYHEFGYKSFSRSFILPENVSAEKIKASHKNGILSVSIPKTEIKKEKARDIKIS